jgi:two-component system, chemotaxis family, sensor kinase Cph1
VFERHHTVEEHEGAGIGSALCQRIVERHGVGIWVESGYGREATFSVTLSAVESNERQSL